jgi:hypothetical protein
MRIFLLGGSWQDIIMIRPMVAPEVEQKGLFISEEVGDLTEGSDLCSNRFELATHKIAKKIQD